MKVAKKQRGQLAKRLSVLVQALSVGLIGFGCAPATSHESSGLTVRIYVRGPDGELLPNASASLEREVFFSEAGEPLEVAISAFNRTSAGPGASAQVRRLQVVCPPDFQGPVLQRAFPVGLLESKTDFALHLQCMPRRWLVPVAVSTGACEAEILLQHRRVGETAGGVLHFLATRRLDDGKAWLLQARPLDKSCVWDFDVEVDGKEKASQWLVGMAVGEGIWVRFSGSVRKRRLQSRKTHIDTRPYRL